MLLPLSGEEAPPPPREMGATGEIARGGAVLLVEDQDMVRDIAESMLRHLGFTVIAAHDGAEAVERFRERPDIRCVVTDLAMPGMNGWETLAALREFQPNLPALVVSGYDEAQAVGEDDTGQPHVFLQKPYSLADLKESLNRMFRKG